MIPLFWCQLGKGYRCRRGRGNFLILLAGQIKIIIKKKGKKYLYFIYFSSIFIGYIKIWVSLVIRSSLFSLVFWVSQRYQIPYPSFSIFLYIYIISLSHSSFVTSHYLFQIAFCFCSPDSAKIDPEIIPFDLKSKNRGSGCC